MSSRCPKVLVNDTTETITALDVGRVPYHRCRDRRARRLRWIELQRSVRPMTIVMIHEDAKGSLEM